MISKETINEVREKTDIVALVESKGVTLKRAGRSWVGLCPVHNERSGSFHVNSESQTYHCFGCQISGDAIAFVQEVDGYTFTGAIEYLADAAGIVVKNTDGVDPDYSSKKEYLAINESAAWYFRQNFARLPDNHPAKVELSKRNLLLGVDWAEQFGQGYAADSYDALSRFLTSKGYTTAQIVDGGLAFVSESTNKLVDRFRNRLMWEIRNIQGKVIGFNGRMLRAEDNPKYLHTGQTVLYNKSQVLYGLDLAKKAITSEKAVYIVEGCTDVQAVKAVGKDNVVASCGTAFGNGHAAIIRRMIDDYDSKNNGRFIFVFDGDNAGMKAAEKAFDISPSIRERSYVALMGTGDPCDVRLNHGDDKLREMLNNQIPITEFVLKRRMIKYDLEVIEQRQAFITEAITLIADIDETVMYESYRRKIAFWTGTPIDQIPNRRSSMAHHSIHPDALEVDQQKELEVRILASLLQYPISTYYALEHVEDLEELFLDQPRRFLMIEAISMAGMDAINNTKTPLRASDFSDEAMVTDLFHTQLNLQEDRVAHFIDKSIELLRRLSRKTHNDSLRRDLGKDDNPSNALNDLAAMLQNRKR